MPDGLLGYKMKAPVLVEREIPRELRPLDVPGAITPFGSPPPGKDNPRSEFGYLVGEIGRLEAALATTLSLDGRYQISTDNLGSPGHEATGPNLKVTNVVDSRVPFQIRSLGQSVHTIQDESLADDDVAHAIQLHRYATGTPAIGIGTGVQLFVADSDNVTREAGNLQVALTAITSNAVSSYISLRARRAGASVEMLRGVGLTGEVRVAAADGWLAAYNLTPSTTHGQINAGNAAFSGGSDQFTGGSAGGTLYAGYGDAGFGGRFIEFQREGASVLHQNADGQFFQSIRDGLTNQPAVTAVFRHKLTGALSPAAGFGAAAEWRGLTTDRTEVQIGEVRFEQASVSNGAQTANYVVSHWKGGVKTEAYRIKADSNALFAFKVLATGGIGVGNAASASTPGTVTRKIEVFDTSGASLGFIPVYAAIT